jgi:hypothetical protein
MLRRHGSEGVLTLFRAIQHLFERVGVWVGLRAPGADAMGDATDAARDAADVAAARAADGVSRTQTAVRQAATRVVHDAILGESDGS